LAKESVTFDFAVPGKLWFIRSSSIFGKMPTDARQANKNPESVGLWVGFDSEEWISHHDGVQKDTLMSTSLLFDSVKWIQSPLGAL